MKNLVWIILLSLIIYGCSSKRDSLLLVTHDPVIYEIIDRYNLNHDKKIKVDFKENERDIFAYALGEGLLHYDLVLGRSHIQNIINKKNFYPLEQFSSKKIKAAHYYMPIYDYFQKYSTCSVPYRMDFPVILAREDALDDFDLHELSMNDFIKLAQKSNKHNSGGKKLAYAIGFSPKISRFDLLGYFFLYNSPLTKEEEELLFFTEQSKKAFDSYYQFDQRYNFGDGVTGDYIKKFSSISHEYYLQQKILSFDIMPLSEALGKVKSGPYHILFLKNMNNNGLYHYLVGVQRTSIYKKEASKFIDYLLSPEIQSQLMGVTFTNDLYYQKKVYTCY